MSQRNNLYRRPSGIYVLRLTVPARHRLVLGQNEIHVSTRSNLLAVARSTARRLLGLWNEHISELEMAENTSSGLKTTSLLKGVISINELSAASGLHSDIILRDLLNHNIPVVTEVSEQPGYLIEEITDVDRENEHGGFVLNSAFEIGSPHLFSGFLKLLNPRNTILKIIEQSYWEEVVFKSPRHPRGGAFFDLPGVRLTTQNLLILKLHADQFFNEAKRSRDLKILTPTVLSVGREAVSIASHGLACENCRPERATEKVSSLMNLFFERKKSSWKPENQKKMANLCGSFVELMCDPPLGALNRQIIWDYEGKLRLMPKDRYQAARRHGTNDAHHLLALAEENNEPRLSSQSVERYIDALSSMLAWGKRNQILTSNPAERVIEKPRKLTREQDDRSKFDQSALEKIFSASWFKTGSGKRNKHGRFHQFRPYFYWLPLLGLYTGARLNELSQLYLSDIGLTKSGIPYIDFNLNQVDKIDFDGPDKSLKTSSAKRIIPVHPALLKLGLLEYKNTLAATGHLRLFPELKRDHYKGYGKPAGSWFNERFLGAQLNMPRDGTLTFHSFRHTFITALSELEIPSDVLSQIVGHSRGESITLTRYRKDTEAERLLTYIQKLDFCLPEISKFEVHEAIDAIIHATSLKK